MNVKSRRETGRRRIKFLPEEDEKLKELVKKYGKSWHQISNEMPGRNVRQCRERWKHYLSSDRAKTPWTNEEDLLLFQKFMELGPKWTKIAKFFDDRTDIQIKTRWIKRFGNASPMFIHPIPVMNEKMQFHSNHENNQHSIKIEKPQQIQSQNPQSQVFHSQIMKPIQVDLSPSLIQQNSQQPIIDNQPFIVKSPIESLKPTQFTIDDIFGEVGNHNFFDYDFSNELKDNDVFFC